MINVLTRDLCIYSDGKTPAEQVKQILAIAPILSGQNRSETFLGQSDKDANTPPKVAPVEPASPTGAAASAGVPPTSVPTTPAKASTAAPASGPGPDSIPVRQSSKDATSTTAGTGVVGAVAGVAGSATTTVTSAAKKASETVTDAVKSSGSHDDENDPTLARVVRRDTNNGEVDEFLDAQE
jgi:hypothetical protein